MVRLTSWRRSIPTLSEKLQAKYGLNPHPRSKAGVALNQQGVCLSSELARILALPRRPYEGTAPDLTEVYAKGIADCGVEHCRVCVSGSPRMRPIQNQMLWEADRRQGLFGMAPIGSGKTLTSLLLHDAMNATRTVLLVKASLRNQLMNVDIPAYGRHFNLPPIYSAKDVKNYERPGVYVIFYSELSDSKKGHWLERIAPDLVVADEVQVFRNKGSARSKRFFRYMEDHPECRFCALSGSMAKRSIRDCGHICELALRKDSPFPNGRTLFEWSCALDPRVEKPLAPGKLLLFCAEGETHHDGFRRRLVESEGVVASTKNAIDTALEIEVYAPPASPAIVQALSKLDSLWRWEEEEVSDALHYARLAKQISQGLYLKWDWPNGEKDFEWLEARSAWHKEVREYLKYHSIPGMDSTFQLAGAASQGRWASKTWAAWAVVKDRYKPEPPTYPVWIDDTFIPRTVAEYVAKINASDEPLGRDRGLIVWYETVAIGDLLEKTYPRFGPGDRDAALLDTMHPKDHPVIVCSRLSHGEGKNLQSYTDALVITSPANAIDWGQAIGRELRPGQMADTVRVGWYGHTVDLAKAFISAVRDAEFLQRTTGEQQFLLMADGVSL